MATVELRGTAWRPWVAAWSSDRALVVEGDVTHLVESSRRVAAWPSFTAAVIELWPRRTVFDRAPWAIGFLTYEACAALAGGLPAHPAEAAVPAGLWLLEPTAVACPPLPATAPAEPPAPLHASLDDVAFAGGVASIRAAIAAGTVYQVNLTRRFTTRCGRAGLAPLVAAAASPPYLARVLSDDFELLCASMELLVRRRGDQVATAPIKGTRRRGRSAAEDASLVAELAADPKELSELAMIVDLARNDLGRVAITGSVRVADPGAVATFAGVHHRLALVTPTVAADLPWWRLLAAVAPGGSVTGCPKIAAMELIRRLEPGPRGPYTGALGVVAGSGEVELALPIRTAWRAAGDIAFAAGGGIVWDSDPAAETAESRLKVARWLELNEGAP